MRQQDREDLVLCAKLVVGGIIVIGVVALFAALIWRWF
jgi:hypothetical protein